MWRDCTLFESIRARRENVGWSASEGAQRITRQRRRAHASRAELSHFRCRLIEHFNHCDHVACLRLRTALSPPAQVVTSDGGEVSVAAVLHEPTHNGEKTKKYFLVLAHDQCVQQNVSMNQHMRSRLTKALNMGEQ
jgi:hypothetical protein